MPFKVSVIIPVFNAENYILKAIQSVLLQEEVLEILVVNDGSTDNTTSILNKLQAQNSRIKLLKHPLGINRGRSASRNLGIRNVSNPFVAFLDADDYYLPKRFKTDKEVFQKFPEADGVYNAINAKFYSNANVRDNERLNLTTLKKRVTPDRLFYEMWPKGYSGSFSIDGLTVKISIFEKTGLFNEKLEVAEDTELLIKMALKAKLYPGELSYPVSTRGVHDENVTHLVKEYIYTRNYFLMYHSLLYWGANNDVSLVALDYFWERLRQHFYLLRGTKPGLFTEIKFWLKTGLFVPDLFKSRRFVKNFPLYNRIK